MKAKSSTINPVAEGKKSSPNNEDKISEKEMNEMNENEIEWTEQNRDIEKGEIIRLKVEPEEEIYVYEERKTEEGKRRISMFPNLKIVNDEGKPFYLYAKCEGGFGTSINTSGRAIMVDEISDSFDEVKEGKSEPKLHGRWNRGWAIEVMKKD